MRAGELNKVASYLFKQPRNSEIKRLMFEIYVITKGLHPKDSTKLAFSQELTTYLKHTKLKEITETVTKLRKIAQFLKDNDHQSELSIRIFAAIKNVPNKRSNKEHNEVTVPLTLEEFELLESLEN